MRLEPKLRREHVFVPLQATSLRAAIEFMLQRLAENGTVRDPESVARMITEARSRTIIAVGDVALPHFRTDSVDELVLAFGVSRSPLAGSESGIEIDPHVVILVLAPPGSATIYLQTVSTLARLLRDANLAARLAAAESADDVVTMRELRELAIEPTLTVRELMSQRAAVTPDTPVRRAVDTMVKERVKALPVVGDRMQVLGIVTEWDVMRAVLPQIPAAGQPIQQGALMIPTDMKVRDIMTRSVLCIGEDMGLDEVANIMVNKDVEQFPVVNEGQLSGFLSRADIIRKLFGR